MPAYFDCFAKKLAGVHVYTQVRPWLRCPSMFPTAPRAICLMVRGYKGGSFGYVWIGSWIFAPFVVSSWNLRFNEVSFGALCSEVH
jgi:hypothetical protein